MPPLPEGNRSPYPIAEPPHVPASQPDPTRVKLRATQRTDTRLIAAIAAGATAALSAIGIGAYLLMNRSAAEEPAPKAPKKQIRKPAARKSRTATSRKPSTATTGEEAAPARKTPRARKPSKDKAVTGTRDRKLIAMGEDHEVAYWTKRFSVDRAGLQAAVDEVGNSAAAVAKHLGKA